MPGLLNTTSGKAAIEMRPAGWESRLNDILNDARTQPYELGVHDCFRVTCRVVEALTGEDRWPEFSGRYKNKREALKLIAEYGSSFISAFDWFFRGSNVSVKEARRGDIVAIRTEDGEHHLGTVTLDGTKAALLASEGLVYLPVSSCLCAWRIG
jgi:hypothetical protein